MCVTRSAIHATIRNADRRNVFPQLANAHTPQLESVKTKFSHRKKYGAQ